MEARLGAARQAGSEDPLGESPTASSEEAGEALAVASEGAPNAWPDEAAESSIISELRERGEKPVAPAANNPVEETDPKNLPALDALVKRLPPEVRETLDDLFRARFVRVTRVPQTALKQ